MSIRFLLTIFFLFTSIHSVRSIREYVIRKDFFRFIKAAEYTIYDRTEKKVLYRIESKLDILQNIQLIAYPSKKQVGQLKAKLKLVYYRGEFSIMNFETNQRQNGSIVQDAKFLANVHYIEWNGKNITMESKPFTITTEFREVNKRELLAEFRLRPSSVFWTRKYDMQIYSYTYPEQLYILALAAYDRIYRKN